MPVSVGDILHILLAQVGDVDPVTGEPPLPGAQGIVAANIGTIWTTYTDKGLISPHLQSLYTMRDSLDLILGVVQDEVNISVGQGSDSEQLGQRAQTILQRRRLVQEEIIRVEELARARRQPKTGLLTTTAPIAPPTQLPDPSAPIDANDPRLRGSPYYRDYFWSIR